MILPDARLAADTDTLPPATRLFTHTDPHTYLTTPAAHTALDPFAAGADADGGSGRERRTRKSVNYAEPKLNTKMRKPRAPSPPPGGRRRGAGIEGAPWARVRAGSAEEEEEEEGDVISGEGEGRKRKRTASAGGVPREEDGEVLPSDAEFAAGLAGRRKSAVVGRSGNVSVEPRRHSVAI